MVESLSLEINIKIIIIKKMLFFKDPIFTLSSNIPKKNINDEQKIITKICLLNKNKSDFISKNKAVNP